MDEEPLREEIHRDMMHLYQLSGQRAFAVKQYETCCHILDRELGISPMDETQALYRHIVNATTTRPTAPVTDLAAVGYAEARQELSRARQCIDEANARLHRATEAMEHALDTFYSPKSDNG